MIYIDAVFNDDEQFRVQSSRTPPRAFSWLPIKHYAIDKHLKQIYHNIHID